MVGGGEIDALVALGDPVPDVGEIRLLEKSGGMTGEWKLR